MGQEVVRAIDVGYGHVKWTEGRSANGPIIARQFESQSPVAASAVLQSDALHRRDTFIVPVNGRKYEVGRDVRLALTGNQETEVLDGDFALSDAYAARLYGALNYMQRGLQGSAIDCLVLGLPMTTYERYCSELARKFSGTHTISESGAQVRINRCVVYPQPVGSYAAYMAEPLLHHDRAPLTLVVDPGYLTVDWFLCEGMTANTAQTHAVERGMSAALRHVARSIIKEQGATGGESEIVRLLDRSLSSNRPMTIAGRQVDMGKHLSAADDVFDEAAQAIRNHVGAGHAIELILVTGGGASLYLPALQRKFPSHNVRAVRDPAMANVRGFHQIGELLARSTQRASASTA